jgi:hypothetical protein
MNETKSITQRQLWLVTGLSAVIVWVLFNVDVLALAAYPLRLFVTYVHESGHALAAIASGGRVMRFTVSPDGSGLASTIGGSRALILPAGYIGAALFGAGLFFIIHRFPSFIRWTGGALGVFLIVFTLMYARPDALGAPTALIVGLLFGLILVLLALRATIALNLIVLTVLAIATGLNAVMDITSLVGYADYCFRAGGQTVVCNDAQAFARDVAPIFPAAVWAFIWAGISIALCALSVYYSMIHPLKRGKSITSSSESAPANTGKNALTGIKRDKDGSIDWT